MEKVWTLTQNISKNNQSTLVSERTGFINFRQWGFKWRYQDTAYHIRYKNIPYLITFIDAARTNDIEKIDFRIAIDCFLQMVEEELDNLPKFCNLIHLKI
ncbi:hypothetical protein GOBAR_DD05610 [Gossypium barbadense]|nr:hypothetical protein GOBAR_DD05610 [Gossypium barbadense]